MAKKKIQHHPNYYEIRKEIYSFHQREFEKHNSNLTSYALFITKILVIINGSAIIVIMTFLGTDIFKEYIGKNPNFDDCVSLSMLGFLISLVMSLITMTLDFFKEDAFAGYFNIKDVEDEIREVKGGQKYILPTPILNENLKETGNRLRKFAIFSGIASAVIFVISSFYMFLIFNEISKLS